MRGQSFSLVVVIAAICAGGISPGLRPLWAARPAEEHAARLVQAALKAEVNSSAESRRELLDAALAANSDYAPARWQSGYVRWQGEWLHVDQVAQRSAWDSPVAEYRQLRKGSSDSLEDHLALARWCRKNNLPDEERVHWLRVLDLQRGNKEALVALKLRLIDNRLLTRQQLVEKKAGARTQLAATHQWHKKALRWRESIERGSWRQRWQAIEQIHRLVDPAALPVMEAAFSSKGETKSSNKLDLLLVEAAGRMPQAEATQLLVRRAIFSPGAPVRQAAIEELKKRPLHTFVPDLVAQAPQSVMTRVRAGMQIGGGMAAEHRLLQEGNGPQEHLVFTLTRPEWERAQQVAQETDAPAAKDSLRERIQEVLEGTLELANLDNPAVWEKTWNDFNGWDSPTYQVQTPPSHSCFPKGTSVLTLSGPMAIEKIVVGDRVLSKDPRTGELAFKAVQRVTVRRPTPIVKLRFESSELSATPGHPFWVVGKGWQVAKHLKPGDRLHTLTGPLSVEESETLEPVVVHNLVVNDFHNFFVGTQRLLVHDNSPLADLAIDVPGLPAEVRVGGEVKASPAPTKF